MKWWRLCHIKRHAWSDEEVLSIVSTEKISRVHRFLFLINSTRNVRPRNSSISYYFTAAAHADWIAFGIEIDASMKNEKLRPKFSSWPRQKIIVVYIMLHALRTKKKKVHRIQQSERIYHYSIVQHILSVVHSTNFQFSLNSREIPFTSTP